MPLVSLLALPLALSLALSLAFLLALPLVLPLALQDVAHAVSVLAPASIRLSPNDLNIIKLKKRKLYNIPLNKWPGGMRVSD